ncbi:MAG TPA: hypothetical protein VNM48_06055 [Chloroflexota bacterium]|nr:hypothetical protein [Chloroflexota bacterium]
MAPNSAPYNTSVIDEADYERLKQKAEREEVRANGQRVLILPDAVYQAERRKIARRRVANKQARRQRNQR